MNSPSPKISRTNNMDIVRYYLAISVLLVHFSELSQTPQFWITNGYTAVGGFFAMSGFLVFRSYAATPNFFHYLIRRARRILPPYLLVVVLCAFLLFGVSKFGVSDYFISSHWVKYILANASFLNFLEPTLPGVFEELHTPAVNGSLWTMKVEWMLYLSVPIVYGLLRRFKWNYAATFGAIYILSAAYRIYFTKLYEVTELPLYSILARQAFGQLMFFYAGVIIYYYYALFLKYKWSIFTGASLLLLLNEFFPLPYFSMTLAPFCISSLILFFSMVGKWGNWFSKYDNVSYDIYLFHFPVIQCVVWSGLATYNTYLGLLVTLLVTFVLAYCSWNFVGKRFIK